jgi:hypothetical protein
MSDTAREQLEAIHGPSANVAVKPGSIIRFKKAGQPERSGELLHVIPANSLKRPHPMLLIVDTGEGMPVYVRLDERIG